MAQFIDEPVTVKITRMRQTSNLDPDPLFLTNEADFKSRVTIDGKVFNGSKFSGKDNLDPGTAWTFSNTVGQIGGLIPITIEMLEEDSGSPDERVDINPLSGKRDLNFFLNLQTGEIFSTESGTGQRLGFVNQTITLGGSERDRGEISFIISGVSGPESNNSIFIQSPFVQESPENSDRLGGSFFGPNNQLVAGDFNNDGRDDLVVGALQEGLAHVSYGSNSGLSQFGTQTFKSNGSTFAVGDINGDTVDDLVLGAVGNVGATIQFGVSGSGLTGASQSISKSAAFPSAVIFGATLAIADFNGDGKDDVATGDPLANLRFGNDGAVQVNYGSSSGITTTGQQVFHRDTPGILGGYDQFNTRFAIATAAGDVNGDGFDDLVIGAPGARDTAPGSGAFHILYGSSRGITTTNSSLIGQSFAGVSDRNGDEFGSAIAVADVNGDRIEDVIVGASGRNSNAGQVYVYFGRQGQNLPNNAPLILTKSNVFGGPSTAGDRFGASIDARDINGDGFADIAIGAPGAEKGTGSVHLIFGSSTGVNFNNIRIFKQGFAGIAGTRETGDEFGAALAIGNFNGSGSAELAVSAPFEDFGNVTDAGMVNIIDRPDALTVSTFSLNEVQSTRSGINRSEILQGTEANGIIAGRGGGDRIFTRAGNDLALGGGGNDHLNGGTEDDILYGGKGRDTLKGSKDQDIFVLAPNTGPDLIKDFRQGEDTIGLAKGIQFEDLRLIQRGSSTLVKTGSDHLATLQGVNVNLLDVNDFVPMDFTRSRGMTVPILVG